MPSDGDGRIVATLALVGQLGFIMVGCVLVGFLGGRHLDRLLDSRPVFTVVLLLGGIAGGMIAVYRLAMKALGEDGHEKNRTQPPA
jgi:F0F1-type ATP synthase assembly protein I